MSKKLDVEQELFDVMQAEILKELAFENGLSLQEMQKQIDQQAIRLLKRKYAMYQANKVKASKDKIN